MNSTCQYWYPELIIIYFIQKKTWIPLKNPNHSQKNHYFPQHFQKPKTIISTPKIKSIVCDHSLTIFLNYDIVQYTQQQKKHTHPKRTNQIGILSSVRNFHSIVWIHHPHTVLGRETLLFYLPSRVYLSPSVYPSSRYIYSLPSIHLQPSMCSTAAWGEALIVSPFIFFHGVCAASLLCRNKIHAYKTVYEDGRRAPPLSVAAPLFPGEGLYRYQILNGLFFGKVCKLCNISDGRLWCARHGKCAALMEFLNCFKAMVGFFWIWRVSVESLWNIWMFKLFWNNFFFVWTCVSKLFWIDK